MAKFFEASDQMVGVSANGELFVVSENDVRRWGQELTKAGVPDFVSYEGGGCRLTATFDNGSENEFTAYIGEGEFFLPECVCEAFCKAFARTYGCTAII